MTLPTNAGSSFNLLVGHSSETEVPAVPAVPPPGLTAIGPHLSEKSLREGALVLTSVGIPHSVVHAAHGAFLLVHDRDYARARKNLNSYEEENRNFPPKVQRERPRYGGIPMLALAFVALVLFAWITGPVASPNGAYFERGASVAARILEEPYRAVTALTLHADGAHVVSNLVSGSIFGRALERRAGPGTALFGVVTAGTLGNLANGLFYRSEGLHHASIGASTGVFAIIGLLATLQMVAFARRSWTPEGKRAWTEFVAPVVGGLTLLGTLGASPETDVLAHVFGFAAGLVVGIPIALAVRWLPKVKWPAEALLGALALSVVGGAWVLAS
jgi:rhomboid protease GluP